MTFGSHRSLRQNSYLSLLSLAIALFVREKLEAAGYPVKMIREVDTAVGDTTLSTLNERKRSVFMLHNALMYIL